MDQILRDTPTQALAAIAILSVLLAVRAQLSLARLRADLEALDNEKADPRTGLLPQTAIPLRLGPELRWAQYAGKSLGVIVFQVHGGHPERAARALRRAMRGEENGYVVGPGRFAIGLWDSDEGACAIAVRRLGAAIQAAGHDVVDAGLSVYPDDGDEIDELLTIAHQHQRPLDQQEKPGRLQPKHARSLLGRFAYVVGHASLGLALSFAAVAGMHAALEWLLAPGHTVPGGDIGIGALAFALGISPFVVGALLWHGGADDLPRSIGQPGSGRWITIVCAAAVGGVLAATTIDPELFSQLPWFGSVVASMAAMLLVPWHARYLIRADPFPMTITLALACGLLALTYTMDPIIANLSRLLVAAILGCLLARAMERAWWVIIVSAAIGIVDIWSVFSSSGPTHKLVEGQGAALDLLMLQGPSVDGAPIFLLGTTDLVFATVFLAFVHFWRLSVIRTGAALLVSATIAFVVSDLSHVGVPVLPFMAVAFLIVNAGQLWRELRSAMTPDDEPVVQE